MSDDYKFSIQRSRALVLAGCVTAVSVLLFFAGTVSGLLYSGIHAKTMPVVLAPTIATRTHSAPDKAPEDSAESATSSSTTPPSDALVPSSVAATTAPAAAVATPPSALAAPSTGKTTATAAPSTAGAAADALASAAPPPAPSSAQLTATAPQTSDASLTVPLAVQVGAFAIKSHADTLVQSLGDMGYKPLVSRSTDTRGHHWYVVKVGPYAQWNAASRVAARISMTEDVTPVIGPMR
jgi:cell division septation protein DedD